VWPSPQIATLTFELGTSSVILPVRPAPKREAPFPIPVLPPTAQPYAGVLGAPPADTAHRDPEGRLTVKRESPEGSYVVPEVGTALSRGGSELNAITEGDPNSCIWSQEIVSGFKRGDWDCRMVARYEITSSPDDFLLKESLKLTNSGEIFFEQETVSKIGRNLL
jgi:hypothetical protein